MGVLFVIFGCLVIVGGFFAKDFYAADIVALGAFKQKRSKWSGRLLFIVVGVFLLALGIKFLMGTD
jgi:hypothetical protein